MSKEPTAIKDKWGGEVNLITTGLFLPPNPGYFLFFYRKMAVMVSVLSVLQEQSRN